jgi:hypothetical protein
MKNIKISNFVDELLSRKVDDFLEVEEGINKENAEIFVNFIKSIYEGEDIAIFMFPFLERLDEFIIEPQNIDIIREMFSIMESKIGNDFDIISSGSFGLHLYKLIEDGEIDFDGNVVITSGRIRKVKEDENNQVEIIKQRKSNITYKPFIFIDDSYYSGGTRDRINDFLRQFHSWIERSFVFYTHKPEDPSEVFSLYCYKENNETDVIPIHKYVEYINNINLKDYENIIWRNIENGSILGVKELLRFIKKLHENNKIKESHIINYKKFMR